MGSTWMFAFDGVRGLDGMQERNAHYAALAQAADGSERFALPATPTNVARGWVQVSGAMLANGLQASGVRLRTNLLLLIVPVWLLALGWRHAPSIRGVRSLGFFALLAASAPLAATALAVRSGHVISFQPLYASFATPFACVALGLGLGEAWQRGTARRPRERILIGVQAIIVLASIVVAWQPQRRVDNPYPRIAAAIAAAVEPTDVLVFPNWTSARYLNVYWLGANSQRIDASKSSIQIQRHGRVVKSFGIPQEVPGAVR
jgi:hypothetical protein